MQMIVIHTYTCICFSSIITSVVFILYHIVIFYGKKIIVHIVYMFIVHLRNYRYLPLINNVFFHNGTIYGSVHDCLDMTYEYVASQFMEVYMITLT